MATSSPGTGVIAEPQVTHRCFTWSRLHKLLTVITPNPFSWKFNSEKSWMCLSLADLWAKSSLCPESSNRPNTLSKDISEKLLVRLCKKITGLLEGAWED